MPPPQLPSPSWRLQPDVHAVVVDDDLVFLSVPGEQYFCLGGAADVAELGPDRDVAISDAAMAAELAAAGLIGAASDGPVAPSRAWRAPTASALRWSYAFPRPGDLKPVLGATLDVARRYRGRGLKEILMAARAEPLMSSPEAAEPSRLLTLVDQFHRWIPFAPVSAKCLLRSFMLRRWLHRHGLTADWVFGVATWPFEAHCWLQSGDLVLDDTVERVAGFTPIMVV